MRNLGRVPLIGIALLLTLLMLTSAATAGPGQRGTEEPDATPGATPGAGQDEFLDPDYDLGGMAGTAGEVLAEGESGELSVIAVGGDINGFAVVLRNDTGEAVGNIDLGVSVRNDDDELVGVGIGGGQQYPAYVPDGGIALIFVNFQSPDLLADSDGLTFEYVISGGAVPDGTGLIFENDFLVTEVEVDGDELSGTAENLAESDGFIPLMRGVCLDDDGALTGTFVGDVEPTTVEPGDEATFTAPLPDDCDFYLFAIVA